jgi:hypothetical protein
LGSNQAEFGGKNLLDENTWLVDLFGLIWKIGGGQSIGVREETSLSILRGQAELFTQAGT